MTNILNSVERAVFSTSLNLPSRIALIIKVDFDVFKAAPSDTAYHTRISVSGKTKMMVFGHPSIRFIGARMLTQQEKRGDVIYF
jgi:hypothetical protein